MKYRIGHEVDAERPVETSTRLREIHMAAKPSEAEKAMTALLQLTEELKYLPRFSDAQQRLSRKEMSDLVFGYGSYEAATQKVAGLLYGNQARRYATEVILPVQVAPVMTRAAYEREQARLAYEYQRRLECLRVMGLREFNRWLQVQHYAFQPAEEDLYAIIQRIRSAEGLRWLVDPPEEYLEMKIKVVENRQQWECEVRSLERAKDEEAMARRRAAAREAAERECMRQEDMARRRAAKREAAEPERMRRAAAMAQAQAQAQASAKASVQEPVQEPSVTKQSDQIQVQAPKGMSYARARRGPKPKTIEEAIVSARRVIRACGNNIPSQSQYTIFARDHQDVVCYPVARRLLGPMRDWMQYMDDKYEYLEKD